MIECYEAMYYIFEVMLEGDAFHFMHRWWFPKHKRIYFRMFFFREERIQLQWWLRLLVRSIPNLKDDLSIAWYLPKMRTITTWYNYKFINFSIKVNRLISLNKFINILWRFLKVRIILFLSFKYIKLIIILTRMKGGKYEQWIEALVVVAFDIDEGIVS